jgi:hypothetical protein
MGTRQPGSSPPESIMSRPQRPDPGALNHAIPLCLVGRNKDGCWVARDAETGIEGLFFSRWGALQFARRRHGSTMSATMFLSQGLELEAVNSGNPLVPRLVPIRRMAARIASPLAVSATKLASSARRVAGRITRAKPATYPHHTAAIERELFGGEREVSFRSDDDLPIVP